MEKSIPEVKVGVYLLIASVETSEKDAYIPAAVEIQKVDLMVWWRE